MKIRMKGGRKGWNDFTGGRGREVLQTIPGKRSINCIVKQKKRKSPEKEMTGEKGEQWRSLFSLGPSRRSIAGVDSQKGKKKKDGFEGEKQRKKETRKP